MALDDRSPSMLKSTAIAGLALGVAGGLPCVNMLNCACCALIIGAGMLAAFLYSKDCTRLGAVFGPGEGAIVGLVAGLFYAIATTAVGAVVQAAMGGLKIEEIMTALEPADLPPNVLDAIERALSMLQGPLGIVIAFFFTLLLAAVFSTIGGLIGGMAFKVEPLPPPPPPAGPFAGGMGEGGGPGTAPPPA